MSSAGRFIAAEEGHVAQLLAPADIHGGVSTTNPVSMVEYDHATVVVEIGANGTGASNPTLTVLGATDSGGATTSAIGFASYSDVSGTGDALGARVNNTSSGLTLDLTNADTIHVLEVDAAELPDGYPYLVVKITDPAGSSAVMCGITGVLSGARYANVQSPTALS